jgi:hypothetical protein
MADASDHCADLKASAGTCDEAAVAGVFKSCRRVLSKPDSKLLGSPSPAEPERLRINFLTKTLGRTEPDSMLDATIGAVMAAMKGNQTKNRLTVLYWLAEKFGKLDMCKA